jgi:hypothetical protein
MVSIRGNKKVGKKTTNHVGKLTYAVKLGAL